MNKEQRYRALYCSEPGCEEYRRTLEALENHMLNAHNGKKIDPFLIKCVFPQLKSATQFTCTFCQKACKEKRYLTAHFKSLSHVKKLVLMNIVSDDTFELVSKNMHRLVEIDTFTSETALQSLIDLADELRGYKSAPTFIYKKPAPITLPNLLELLQKLADGVVSNPLSIDIPPNLIELLQKLADGGAPDPMSIVIPPNLIEMLQDLAGGVAPNPMSNVNCPNLVALLQRPTDIVAPNSIRSAPKRKLDCIEQIPMPVCKAPKPTPDQFSVPISIAETLTSCDTGLEDIADKLPRTPIVIAPDPTPNCINRVSPFSIDEILRDKVSTSPNPTSPDHIRNLIMMEKELYDTWNSLSIDVEKWKEIYTTNCDTPLESLIENIDPPTTAFIDQRRIPNPDWDMFEEKPRLME